MPQVGGQVSTEGHQQGVSGDGIVHGGELPHNLVVHQLFFGGHPHFVGAVFAVGCCYVVEIAHEIGLRVVLNKTMCENRHPKMLAIGGCSCKLIGHLLHIDGFGQNAVEFERLRPVAETSHIEAFVGNHPPGPHAQGAAIARCKGCIGVWCSPVGVHKNACFHTSRCGCQQPPAYETFVAPDGIGHIIRFNKGI